MIRYYDPLELWRATEHLRDEPEWNPFMADKIFQSINLFGYCPSHDDIINIVLGSDGGVIYLEGHKRLYALAQLGTQKLIAVEVSEAPVKALRIDPTEGYRFTKRLGVAGLVNMLDTFKAWYHPIEYLPHMSSDQARTECSSIFEQVRHHMGHSIRGGRILDAGPFFGYFTFKLAQEGADVTAVEIDHGNYKVLQAIQQLHGTEAELVNMDILDYTKPYLGSQYRYALLLNMWHYMYQQDKTRAWQLLNDLHGCWGVYMTVNHEMLGLPSQEAVPAFITDHTKFKSCANLGRGRSNKREGVRTTYVFR